MPLGDHLADGRKGRPFVPLLQLGPLAAGTEHMATVAADGATVERFGCRVVFWTGGQAAPVAFLGGLQKAISLGRCRARFRGKHWDHIHIGWQQRAGRGKRR